MSEAVTIFFDVKAGQLRIDNLPALTQWLAAHEGQHGRATFEPTDPSKRGRLAKFYRYVVLVKAGEHEGNDISDQHGAYWDHLLPDLPRKGAIHADIALLADADLSRYVQDCVRLAASNGCVIQERP